MMTTVLIMVVFRHDCDLHLRRINVDAFCSIVSQCYTTHTKASGSANWYVLGGKGDCTKPSARVPGVSSVQGLAARCLRGCKYHSGRSMWLRSAHIVSETTDPRSQHGNPMSHAMISWFHMVPKK